MVVSSLTKINTGYYGWEIDRKKPVATAEMAIFGTGDRSTGKKPKKGAIKCKPFNQTLSKGRDR